MSSELFRRYIDIINEGQQPIELDEGLLSTVKDKVVAYAQKVFSPQDMQAMKAAVEKATGKPIEQVSVRDLGGQTALAIASALGAKASAGVKESQLDEIMGIEDPRVTQLRKRGIETGYPYSDEQLKQQQDYFDYEKYGVTTSMLAKRILGFGTQFAGLAGTIGTIMGNIPWWAGLISIMAFFIGSLVALRADK